MTHWLFYVTPPYSPVNPKQGIFIEYVIAKPDPELVITWTPANIIIKRAPGGSTRRVIRNDQGKTGVIVDIAITPDIDAILKDLRMDDIRANADITLIHRMDGDPYTYDGLSSMLRRYIGKTPDNKLRKSKKEPIVGFGFYDLKAKGATEMWLSGVPLEKIQVLCGHDSVTTTEIYVKCRWRGTVEPNRVKMDHENDQRQP
jgi:integrase